MWHLFISPPSKTNTFHLCDGRCCVTLRCRCYAAILGWRQCKEKYSRLQCVSVSPVTRFSLFWPHSSALDLKWNNDFKVKVLTFSFKGVWGCSHLYWVSGLGLIALFTLGGICIEKAMQFIKRGRKHNQIKAESQHFNRTVVVSFQIQCAGLQSQNNTVLILWGWAVCVIIIWS